jgi:hypothetical protein
MQWVSDVRNYCAKHSTLYQYCEDLEQFLAEPGEARSLRLKGLAFDQVGVSVVEISPAGGILIGSMLGQMRRDYHMTPRLLHGHMEAVDATNKYHLGRAGPTYLVEGTVNITLYCK